MKISELITKLAVLHAEYGDIRVTTQGYRDVIDANPEIRHIKINGKHEKVIRYWTDFYDGRYKEYAREKGEKVVAL
jgi:hypothetical protein